MGDNGEILDYSGVKSKATEMDGYANSMKSNLDGVSAAMDSLSSAWEDDAATNVRNKFAGFKESFDDFYKLVTNKAQNLTDAVVLHEKAQAAINSAMGKAAGPGTNVNESM